MNINASLNILFTFIPHKQYIFTPTPEVASGKKIKIDSLLAINQHRCGSFCNMLLGIIINLKN